jgi:hypothetical protein
MSLSFGGLGLISLWTPLYFWDDSAHARNEFRSFVFALVFVAVVLILGEWHDPSYSPHILTIFLCSSLTLNHHSRRIPPSDSTYEPLAYLTNPSETSFRAYLTEQSFRQHLSHLDDATDESSDTDTSYPSPRSRFMDRNTLTDRTPLPFHFANHASVSLRTPKHVFHSFGICTIATTRGAVGANGRSSSSTSAHGSGNLADEDHDGSVVSDSWFIGAYGHWWRGGLIESWYQDAMIRSKDAEGWSSGILGFKALDKLNELNGVFFQCGSYPSVSISKKVCRLRSRFPALDFLLVAPHLGCVIGNGLLHGLDYFPGVTQRLRRFLSQHHFLCTLTTERTSVVLRYLNRLPRNLTRPVLVFTHRLLKPSHVAHLDLYPSIIRRSSRKC